ncbi:hypothetical protein V1525DRAFT_396470 [Lipomyces kononenkoae]|uniref:Uncharacterized protein n=1 Tax=Lipomyces kononenkoae TaxID=34357 RepID=A0ACC3T7N9_LIPKO
MDRRELEEYQFQLAAVNESLESDPHNESLLTLRSELTDLIALLKQARREIEGYSAPITKATNVPNKASRTVSPSKSPAVPQKPQTKGSQNESQDIALSPRPPVAQLSTRHAPPPLPPSPPPPPPPPDFSRNISPPPPPPPQPKESFKTGDVVLARWLSGDKQYHRAKIAGITGSSTQPMYTVKFSEHASTDTVPLSCVRAVSGIQTKRKAPVPEQSDTSVNGAKLSGIERPAKAAKAQEKKVLDQGKAKWQEFSSKGVKTSKFGKAKRIGETSMFKSPDDVSGRVGIINSGRPMTKDYKRSKHVYNVDHANEN